MPYIKKTLKEKLEKLHKARLKYELIKTDVYKECSLFEGEKIILSNGVQASIVGKDVGFKWPKEVKSQLNKARDEWQNDSSIKRDRIIYVQFCDLKYDELQEDES